MKFTLRAAVLLAACLSFVGCATTAIPVTVPEASGAGETKGYVRIDKIADLRDFQRAPRNPSTPSIEGDDIDDTEKRRRSIGRMRHGTYHHALWNFSFVDGEDIYGACRKIVTSSLSSAGYQVVSPGHAEYDSAIPVAVDVIEFWAWMQPKFNIDVNFDGKLRVRSTQPSSDLDVTVAGKHSFSTAYAGQDAWTEVVKVGVKKMHQDMEVKLGGPASE